MFSYTVISIFVLFFGGGGGGGAEPIFLCSKETESTMSCSGLFQTNRKEPLLNNLMDPFSGLLV